MAGEGRTEPQERPTDETLPVGAGGGPASLPQGVPRSFARYRILDVIGRGGMGVVYRAVDPLLDRTVALKTLIEGEWASPERVERFFREASSAARLHHPNIVPIHEFDVWEGKSYFTMDCVEGSPLDEVIENEEIEPRRAAELAEKIARAVHHAHEQGIIHRDLKPANIIVDERGEPQVTDFGLAKELGRGTRLTRTGDFFGTPSYMPPEQAEGRARDMDARSDVYALGAVLYEMLTRRLPFVADNVFKLVRMIAEERPVAPSKADPRVPSELDRICLKALEKDPHNRYQSAEEFAEDCWRFLEGEPIQARPAPPQEKPRKREAAGAAEEELQRIRKEISAAMEIQANLLPNKIPQIPGFDIYPYWRSATELGGNYYDFIPVDRGRLALVVARVSSKGIPGAMLMATTRTIMHMVVAENPSPADILMKTNAVLSREIKRGMFVTAMLAVINVKQKNMLLCSAGHHPMVLFREPRKQGWSGVALINPNGLALGIGKGAVFNKAIQEASVGLYPGDRYVFHTAGVVEAMNAGHEQFGDERLYRFVQQNARLSSKEFVAKLVKALDEHRGEAPQSDDITIVTVGVD